MMWLYDTNKYTYQCASIRTNENFQLSSWPQQRIAKPSFKQRWFLVVLTKPLDIYIERQAWFCRRCAGANHHPHACRRWVEQDDLHFSFTGNFDIYVGKIWTGNILLLQWILHRIVQQDRIQNPLVCHTWYRNWSAHNITYNACMKSHINLYGWPGIHRTNPCDR